MAAKLTAPVVDSHGKGAADAELEDAVFGVELKPHLVHEVVRAESAAARAGTQAAKSRGEVSGGGAKPWRQKGTGRARQGTVRAPQFAGGGQAFPPKPRSYDVKVNRKVRKTALRGALSAHAGGSSLVVLEGDDFSEPSTKTAAGLLDGLDASRPVLVVCGADEDAVSKSFRNLERVGVTTPYELEVRALAWARTLVLTKSALGDLEGLAT